MNPSIKITLIFLVGAVVAGCAASGYAVPGPTPTETPVTITVDGKTIVLVPGENISPEIYEAIRSPEILENSEWILVDGFWDLMPRGVNAPLEADPPTFDPAVPPDIEGIESWETFASEGSGFSFQYPSGWQVIMKAESVQLVAPENRFVVRVDRFPNPAAASLTVWLAEYAPVLGGVELLSFDEAIQGIPVRRQQVMLPAAEAQPGGEHAILWIGHMYEILMWMGWPGDQPETIDLISYMASTLQ